MTDTPNADPEGTAWWAKFTLIGGVVAALLLIMGPVGYRLGVLDVQGAVLMAPGMATALAAITLLFALVGMILTLTRGLVAERAPVLFGGVLALAILINMGMQFARSQSVPPIHDITTNPADPPRFDALVEIRGAGANSLDYNADALAEATREAYPFLRSIDSELAPSAAFDRAEVLVAEFGWKQAAADRQAGRIEATDTTAMYGFKDDVVIRIRPRGEGSLIDLRSVSRVGQSDLGANAARIQAFMERF
jgi:hypothetical protein